MLVVDKPPGPTSHDVVTLARRALGVSRIGHTGTLDPMATGVLPLVIGRATRLAQFLTASDKDYEATVAFGRTTNTYDAMGTVVTTSAERPTREQIEAALPRFRGTFEQTPPAFSAKNIDGERSYEIARKAKDGVDQVRPKPVTVTVRELELVVVRWRHGRAAHAGRPPVSTSGRWRTTWAPRWAWARCWWDCGGRGPASSASSGAVPLADVLQADREALAARLLPFSGLLPELPAVTLRGPEELVAGQERRGNRPRRAFGAPQSASGARQAPGHDGTLVALAKPAKTAGFLHASIVSA